MTVDNCFHYLWGGGYVIEAAKRGYICYTNCTSTLAEVAHPLPSLSSCSAISYRNTYDL